VFFVESGVQIRIKSVGCFYKDFRTRGHDPLIAEADDRRKG